MKSLHVHYLNVYPNAIVHSTEDSLDVHTSLGHAVALRKNGAGQVVDMSKQLGCYSEHDLAPIPKDARVYKLYKDGSIGKSEEAQERAKLSEKFLCSKTKKVLSCEKLSDEGRFQFDEKGQVIQKPVDLSKEKEELLKLKADISEQVEKLKSSQAE